MLLDLSAAFDAVDHSLLLTLLEQHFGIVGKALDVLRSYLTRHSQCVSVENILSELTELIFGVQQGSVLGPIIFCMYTLPLGAILFHHQLGYHIYADNTQIYLRCDVQDPVSAIDKLNLAINAVRSWMIKSKLKINDDKSEFIVLIQPHKQGNVKDLQLQIGRCSVATSSQAKNLGVIFDCELTLKKQISSVCRSSFFHLRNSASVHIFD